LGTKNNTILNAIESKTGDIAWSTTVGSAPLYYADPPILLAIQQNGVNYIAAAVASVVYIVEEQTGIIHYIINSFQQIISDMAFSNNTLIVLTGPPPGQSNIKYSLNVCPSSNWACSEILQLQSGVYSPIVKITTEAIYVITSVETDTPTRLLKLDLEGKLLYNVNCGVLLSVMLGQLTIIEKHFTNGSDLVVVIDTYGPVFYDGTTGKILDTNNSGNLTYYFSTGVSMPIQRSILYDGLGKVFPNPAITAYSIDTYSILWETTIPYEFYQVVPTVDNRLIAVSSYSSDGVLTVFVLNAMTGSIQGNFTGSPNDDLMECSPAMVMDGASNVFLAEIYCQYSGKMYYYSFNMNQII